MEPPDLWYRDHFTTLRQFSFARDGRVSIERQMSPRFMVIVEIRIENAREMSLIENDDMVKALAAYRAYHSLHVRILPWRSWRRDDFFDTHVLDALAEELAVDPVAIANQKTRRCIIGERLDNLLGRPDCSRVRCHAEVDDSAALVAQHDKGEKYAECSGRDGEEVNRDDILNMIVEKRTPSL